MDDIILRRGSFFPLLRLPRELAIGVFEFYVAGMSGDNKYNDVRPDLEKLSLTSECHLSITPIQRHVITLNFNKHRTIFHWPASRASKAFLHYVLLAASRIAIFSLMPVDFDPAHDMRVFMSRLSVVFTQRNVFPGFHYSIFIQDDDICDRSVMRVSQSDIPRLVRRGSRSIQRVVNRLEDMPWPILTLRMEFDKQWQFYPEFHSAFTNVRRQLQFPVEIFYRLYPTPGNPIGPITPRQHLRVVKMVSAIKNEGRWNHDIHSNDMDRASVFHHKTLDYGKYIARFYPRFPPRHWDGVVG